MSKRTTINNGIRILRYPMLLVIWTGVLGAIKSSEGRELNILVALIFILLFLLLWVMRRLRFDDENIYKIYGSKEKVVPLSSVIRFEASGAKMNSRRMWKLFYLDKDGKKRKIHFVEGTFQHGSVKELIKRLPMNNPDVEIEESYFWKVMEPILYGKKKKKKD